MKIKIMLLLLVFAFPVMPIAEELDALSQSLNNLSRFLAPEEDVYRVGDKTIKLVMGDMETQKGIEVITNAANTRVTTAEGSGTAGAIEAVFPVPGQEAKGSFSESVRNRYADLVGGTHGQTGKAYIGKLPEDKEGVLYTPKKPRESLYDLGYRYMLSAVGPVCGGSDMTPEVEEQLRGAYYNSLVESEDVGATSIVLPRISMGIFRCRPEDVANRIAVETVVNYLRDHPDGSLKTVYFIFWPGGGKASQDALNDYRALLNDSIK